MMFGFLNRTGTSSTAAAVQRALASSDLPVGLDPARLSVVESRGSYAGRKVTYFRVFDPRQADGRVVKNGKRLNYQDLEPHNDLVVRAGYVEEDGTVMLNRTVTDEADAGRPSAAGSIVPGRAPANRAAHPDNERFVAGDNGR